MTSSVRLCTAAVVLVAAAASASAAELRLADADLDRVTAGEIGVPVTSIGNNTDFAPFPSSSFGGFDLFDGPLSPPPPPPPVVTPPINGGGGGGGSPIQNILSILLNLPGILR